MFRSTCAHSGPVVPLTVLPPYWGQSLMRNHTANLIVSGETAGATAPAEGRSMIHFHSLNLPCDPCLRDHPLGSGRGLVFAGHCLPKPWMELRWASKREPKANAMQPAARHDRPPSSATWCCPSSWLTSSSGRRHALGFADGSGVHRRPYVDGLLSPRRIDAPQGIYEKRPFKLFAINSGYWLLGLFIVGGLLAAWR